MRNDRGFTILEVLIAVAILAIATTALLGTQSRSVVQNDHGRQLSTAAMLAHDQMIHLQNKMKKDGFKSDRERERGTFEGREYRDFRWEAIIDPIDMRPEDLSSQLQGQLLGTTEDEGSLSGSNAINAQLPTMLGMITMMIQNITDQRIRRVTLAVHWEDLKGEHTFTLRQFVVLMEPPEGEGSLNPGTIPGSSVGSGSSGSRRSSGSGGRGGSSSGGSGSGGGR